MPDTLDYATPHAKHRPTWRAAFHVIGTIAGLLFLILTFGWMMGLFISN
jgi:hypothetical protein